MAFASIASDPAPLQLILSTCLAAVQLRDRASTERQWEEAERLVAPLYDELLETRATSPRMIVAKGEALLAEFAGAGLVEREIVEALLADVRRLEQ